MNRLCSDNLWRIESPGSPRTKICREAPLRLFWKYDSADEPIQDGFSGRLGVGRIDEDN